MDTELTKRIPFDREQRVELTDATLELIFDEERLLDGFRRIYTVISVVNIDHSCTKIRFGTGDEAKQKWHEEEPTVSANVYYHTEREHHCRLNDNGAVGIYGGTIGDHIVVIWHGYDEPYTETEK